MQKKYKCKKNFFFTKKDLKGILVKLYLLGIDVRHVREVVLLAVVGGVDPVVVVQKWPFGRLFLGDLESNRNLAKRMQIPINFTNKKVGQGGQGFLLTG